MLSSRHVVVIWKLLFPTALHVSLSVVSFMHSEKAAQLVTLGVSRARTLTRPVPLCDCVTVGLEIRTPYMYRQPPLLTL